MRARSEDHSITLPIQEEAPTARGRFVTRKSDTAIAKRAIALLPQKQQQIQNEGQMRVHLGRFVRNFQAMHKAAARAATAPSQPKTRSYDDIEKEIEEDPLAGGVRKKVALPEGAFVTGRRVNTSGKRRLRSVCNFLSCLQKNNGVNRCQRLRFLGGAIVL